MRTTVLLLACLAPLAAQTTVTETITDFLSNPASGTAVIALQTACTSGSSFVPATRATIPFTGGSFSVALVPNDTCAVSGPAPSGAWSSITAYSTGTSVTYNGQIWIAIAPSLDNPPGTSLVPPGAPNSGQTVSGIVAWALVSTTYNVQWILSNGETWTETWLVPTSVSPVTVASVRVAESGLPTILGTIPAFGGDLSGTIGAAKVIGFDGRPLAFTAPINGQAYVWNGTQWAPATVSGSGAVSSVFGRTGAVVAGNDYNTSQVSEGSNLYYTGARVLAVTPVGDVGGMIGANTVTGLQGRSVGSTAPTNGQVYIWNGSQWLPGTVSAGGGATMASQLGDLAVTRTSAAVLTIGANCSSSTPCNVRFGYQVTSITAPATATLSGTAIGTAYVYLTPAGGLVVGHNLTVACSGCTATPAITSFPINSLPLFTWTATTGTAATWDVTGGSDVRAFLSAKTLAAGTGIVLTETPGLTTVAADTAGLPSALGGGGDLSGTLAAATVIGLQGRIVASTPPTNGQTYVWNSGSSQWVPGTVSGSGGAGMASQLGDLAATLTSAAVVTIGANCSSSTPCNVRFGYQTYSIIAPATATLSGTAIGTAYGYVNTSGAIIVGHNLTVACSGCTQVPGITSFPPNTLPLFTWTATTGTAATWDTLGGADLRGFLSAKIIIAGTGIIATEAPGQTTLTVDVAGILAEGGDLSGMVGSSTVIGFYGRPLSNTAPSGGQAYVWTGSQWLPGTPAPGGSPNQILWNNAGSMAGFTASGDGTLVPSTGLLNITGTHLALPLPRVQGGLNSTTAGTGILRDGATPVASELSGDTTTSGSNVTTTVATHLSAPLPVAQGGWGTANCTTPPFSADVTGGTDSTTGLTACLNSLAPGGTNANSYIVISAGRYQCSGGPLVPTGVVHGMVWVLTGASFTGCTPPLNIPGQLWVKDETSEDVVIWGSLSLPNVTTFSMDTFQPCDFINECAAITTANWLGAREASPTNFLLNPVPQPLPGAVNAGGGILVEASGLSTGNGSAGAIQFQQYLPGSSGGADNTKTTTWQISSSQAFQPGADNVYNIGGSSLRPATIEGMAIKADASLKLNGSSVLTGVNGTGTFLLGATAGSYTAGDIITAGTGGGVDSGSQLIGAAVWASCIGTSATAQTFYLFNGGSTTSCATAGPAGVPMPFACTAGNLWAVAGTAATTSDAISIYKNGTITGVTCAITSSVTKCSDTSDVVTFAAGDTWSVGGVSVLSDTIANVRASFSCK